MSSALMPTGPAFVEMNRSTGPRRLGAQSMTYYAPAAEGASDRRKQQHRRRARSLFNRASS